MRRIVFLYFVFLCVGIAHTAHAATLNFSTKQSVGVGSAISVPITLSTAAGESANAVSARVQYPPELLKLVSVSKAGSIVSIWPGEPTYSTASATVEFEGIILNPGWSGSNGIILTLTFEALRAGTAEVSFAGASVLANDGKGTNILTMSPTRTISITSATPLMQTIPGSPSAPRITSSSHPDQQKWYGSKNVQFSWSLPADATAVRILYDNAPVTEPTVLYAPPISSKSITVPEDGVYYFHAQFKNATGWGATTHYKFQIDATPPQPFVVRPAHAEDTEDPRPILFFNTSDNLSGVDYYDIKVGDKVIHTIAAGKVSSNPYTPPFLGPGTKKVTVVAYDRAGNVSTSSAEITVNAIDPPVITEHPSEITEGDLLRVRGKTYPDSLVTMHLTDEEGVITEDTGRTNASGNFTVIWTKQLKPGKYTFFATVVDTKGAQSYATETYTVLVRPLSYFSKGAHLGILILLIFIAILGVGLLAATAIYMWYRLHAFKRRMSHIASHTHHLVHHDIETIADELGAEVKMLERAKKHRALTKEEALIHESLKSKLKFIRRTTLEVRDIEKEK